MKQMSKENILYYLRDYGYTVIKSPIRNLYYFSNTDGFLIDFLRSEHIDYFWQFGTIHFILGKLGKGTEYW